MRPEEIQAADNSSSGGGTSKYYLREGIQWRVLQNEDGKLFLLSEKNLDAGIPYHTDPESVTWKTSTVRSWLNGYGAGQNIGGTSGADYSSNNFIGSAFLAEENSAIAETAVANPENPYNYTPGGNDTTDKIFFLSIQEAENADLRFSSDSDRIAKNTDYTATRHSAMSNSGAEDYWWLRSPGNEVYRAVCVYTDGRVLSNGNNVDLPGRAVRPAFFLDLSSVFFTSAAAGGKAATVGSDLADAETAAGDIKFTIFDAAQTLTVDKSNLPQPGATLAFSYSGAKSGANQFVSCVLEREGKVEYYGKLVEADSASAASGTLYVPMTGVADGAYTLKIFSEQVNGDYLTDFAGTPEIMNLTVDGGTATVSAKIDSPPEENGVSGGCDTGAAGLLLLTGMVLMGVKNRRV